MPGFESFPEINKTLEWTKHSAENWKKIFDGQEPVLPTNPEEAKIHIDQITYLKENNQEKYRDTEGVEFYKRLDDYIEKLKEVK